jgi:hypothetical protein
MRRDVVDVTFLEQIADKHLYDRLELGVLVRAHETTTPVKPVVSLSVTNFGNCASGPVAGG